MAKVTEYITSQGERWDTIAYKAYGDAAKFQPIIEANPGVAMNVVFEPGIRLLIPIVETQTSGDQSLLPPWKRVKSTTAQQAAAVAPAFNNLPTELSGSYDGSYD